MWCIRATTFAFSSPNGTPPDSQQMGSESDGAQVKGNDAMKRHRWRRGRRCLASLSERHILCGEPASLRISIVV